MTITVEIKSIYGNVTIYPVCDKAREFCNLLGQKTLTRQNIESIKKLGFTIVKQEQDFGGII